MEGLNDIRRIVVSEAVIRCCAFSRYNSLIRIQERAAL